MRVVVRRNSAWMRLLGVVLASFSAGFGEITFLALASFYPKYRSPAVCMCVCVVRAVMRVRSYV